MERKLADFLHLDPSSITVPEGITSKDIYEDLIRLKWDDLQLDAVKEWLTTGSSSKIESNIHNYENGSIYYHILKQQAGNNYERLIPSLKEFPNPTVTKCRIRTTESDLDRHLLKPVLEHPTAENDVTRLLVHVDPEYMNIVQIEYYDMYLLRHRMNPNLFRKEALVFQDLINTETVTYEQPERANFAVIGDAPPEVNVSHHYLTSVYAVFCSCVALGMNKVLVYESTINIINVRQPYRGLADVIIILAAWLSGLSSVVIDSGNLYPFIIDLYDKARTPREFIRAYTKRESAFTSLIEHVFDHKLMIADFLEIEKDNLRLPSDINLEELAEDVEKMVNIDDENENEHNTIVLRKVLTGGELPTQEAKDFFFKAGDLGCGSIMVLLISMGYVNPRDTML